MPNSRIIRKGQNVARYDDDYPLLYGEPAPQPQWDAPGLNAPQGASQAQQQQSAADPASTSQKSH